MSAQEFKRIFENNAFKNWYKEPETDMSKATALQIGREESKNFVRNSVGDFIISQEQLGSIFGNKNTAAKIVEAAKSGLYDFKVQVREVAGQTQVLFPKIKYSTLNNTISGYLQDIAEQAGIARAGAKLRVEEYLEDKDIGHVFGFSNTLLIRIKEQAGKRMLTEAERAVVSARGIGDTRMITDAEANLINTQNQIKALEDFVDALVTVLEDYDIATSDIAGLDLDVNVQYRKTSSNWLFEWQSSVENQKSGRTVGGLLGKIKNSKLFGPGIRGLFATAIAQPKSVEKALEGLVEQFKSVGISNKGDLSILNQKGSPSLKEMIADELVSALSGKSKKYRESYSGNVKLNPVPLVRTETNTQETQRALREAKKLQQQIASTKAKAKAKLAEATRQAAAKKSLSEPTSLGSLLSYINARLFETLRGNMGTGSLKSILNYRTGRFASSVNVERLTQSRDGMISAFYSYMKNPYATFSQGGAQEYPRSRDPKLLISRSIREIAAEKVSNKLRAVSV